ncbi:mammalian cell entry protein [Hydrogenophaga sp. PAMC20947]|uniref:MlaD family protein n=1 Tax=Hydrogenophaga sp. PAMC20947 TaxID=2565558 RepID=UPI00109DC52F|nr:mammalian cell entry protein [Hydrogenophaga sp. PAMC20947]QCB45938.1 mammalian cell entry protein [Hydrogenophaga sp. PAMC20947]
MSTPPNPPSGPVLDPQPPVKNLEFKAGVLLLLLLTLLVGSALYVMYARGVFERTQRLVLMSDDSEGVVAGMDMTFAGFAIGTVARIELAEDGNVRILVDVPIKDAKWLRSSSIFTMEKALVGGTKIRAYSGMLSDPPLEEGAVRQVLRGDAAAEFPRLLAQVRDLLDNLNGLTREGAPLTESLANLQAVTATLKGPQGAMGLMFGNETDAQKIVTTIDRANAVLGRADQLAKRLDGLVANADQQVFGASGKAGVAANGGLVNDARATVQELNNLLGNARGSLQKVDQVLVEAQGIASNTREATTDLTTLRAEVEASLRKVDSLVNDLNRKWPFARDAEIVLP